MSAARALRIVRMGLGCLVMSLVIGTLLTACGEGPSTPAAPHAAASGGGTTPLTASPLTPKAGDKDALMVGGYPAEQFLLERDRFLPATDPRVVSAKDVPWLLDDDEVFGVFRGTHARAYPVTMISYHHGVNDTLDGIPILVTY